MTRFSGCVVPGIFQFIDANDVEIPEKEYQRQVSGAHCGNGCTPVIKGAQTVAEQGRRAYLQFE